ncbi:MAG: UDP-N-acetylglucosamine 2-epimerase (non-hydrolyzing), partial [Spirochaetes bacterium]|nr:UDP-N-acetylglucosamine 2-epimerase (non-hydrolyzing) [Spirochaetota bacterium]
MKIATVLGARPQFIKASAVSRALKKHSDTVDEVIIHTGQHYDYGMSEVFFKELEIPEPKYNLGISSLSHGAMTGKMIEGLEKILIAEKPDIVLLYGDTNSTLAGAVTASKLHIPAAHVEAGLRSFNNQMPEEINRILTDRISSLLFVPTDVSIKNLEAEGFNNFGCQIIRSGDVMYDSILFGSQKAVQPDLEIPDDFILATLHRPETTNSRDKLKTCIDVFKNDCPIHVFLILHPGTKEKIAKYGIDTTSDNLTVIPPLSYYEMLYLLKKCRLVATDSGGLQKEAFWMDKYCVTLRTETEWTELSENGFNSVCGYDREKIRYSIFKALEKLPFDSKDYDFY